MLGRGFRSSRAVLAAVALGFILCSGGGPPADAGKGKGSASPGKALAEAKALLAAHQLDRAVEKLQGIVKDSPDDPAAAAARDLLVENGIGEEVRVRFEKSETFRDKLKVFEKDVLQ